MMSSEYIRAKNKIRHRNFKLKIQAIIRSQHTHHTRAPKKHEITPKILLQAQSNTNRIKYAGKIKFISNDFTYKNLTLCCQIISKWKGGDNARLQAARMIFVW